MAKGARVVIFCAALFTLVLTAGRAYRAWRSDAYLDHASGAMATLALDFKDGVLYRPLYGPMGYGGTRYSPLHFVLYAELWKLWGDFRRSGYLLAAVETFLLLAGVYWLLRRLGVDRLLAFCCAALVLTSEAVELCLHGFHADTVAAMLNVWGLGLCAGAVVGSAALVAAALLFALSFAAKVTSVAGVVTAFLALLLSGRSRQAWRLLGMTAAGYLAAVAIFYFASQGRWWETFRASATAGSSPSRYLLLLVSPFYVFWNAAYRDAGALSFLLLACIALVAWPRRAEPELPRAFFGVAAFVAGVVLVSPGTGITQGLEPMVAALVIIPAWLRREEGRPAALATLALAIASLIALPPQLFRFTEWDRIPRRQRAEEALRLIGNTQKPILSENPILPLMAGQRPYVLDESTIRIVRARDPSFAEPLWKALREQAFSAVVLLDDPRMPGGPSLYNRRSRFDEELYRRVEENYELVSRNEDQYVFLPRKR